MLAIHNPNIRSILLCLVLICLPLSLFSQTYVERFQQYWEWNEHFPPIVTSDFLNFIKESKPLSIKLRNRYLYYLARQKDWAQIITIYQPTNDISLECVYLTAQLNLNPNANIWPRIQQLWTTGQSLPASCNDIGVWLSKKKELFQTLIKQRLPLVLEDNNIGLARYLIKHFVDGGQKETDKFNKILQNPKVVEKGSIGWLQSQLYLFGLKRLISRNMPLAIEYFHSTYAQKLLNEAQKQSFLRMLVTYQAMRNDIKTLVWFKEIKPKYYTSELLEWQIRYSIRNHNWQRVLQLTKLGVPQDPCWTYWQARALEELGNNTESKTLYESLAKTRNYYGFLANIRLKTKLHFQDETMDRAHTVQNNEKYQQVLASYLPILNQIKTAYYNNQKYDASRMTSDFALELSSSEKSALVHWINSSLQWHAKAILMSNTPDLVNSLTIRFPLAHQSLINNHANNYKIPPELIFAVIRQESGFREEVISSAGAHGLMQLMPTTAKKVSVAHKIPYLNIKELFLSQKNIELGTAYLHTLAKTFQNHPVLMAAAYNAGPRQAMAWAKNNSSQPVDIWVETIPWRETRNYIKNIMAFYLVYQYRLNQKPDISPLLKEINL